MNEREMMGALAAFDQYGQPVQPPPFEGPMPQAEMRSYKPTFRDNMRARLLGDDPSNMRRQLVNRLVGNEGNISPADFIPGGGLLSAQEDWRKGDYTGAAVSAIPGVGAAKKIGKNTVKAVGDAIGDLVAAPKSVETVAGFAPGSVFAPTVAKQPRAMSEEEIRRIAGRYVTDPKRVANPGIYKRPDVIAREAAERVEPEHPALKELFGVTRQDLYDISQQGRRQGNVKPELWQPSKATKPNEAALAVMNPANEQRLLDTLAEARKHPGLEQGMVPWYVMDPMYQRMVQLVGPERAAKEYRDFNMSVTPFSAGSSVPSEINRGTAANMMRQRGEYDVFKQYGGLKAGARGGEDYPEILRDVSGMMGHLNQANPVERYMQTGKHGYGKDQVKIDLYSGASGVPQTGFQTSGAVPDAHFTRAIGVPDARSNPKEFNDYMGGTEYRQIGPWYRDKIAKPLGIEAVPAQALMWGTYGPQTGVKTKIGAGKLELMSKQIWERATKLGIDPKKFRDDVLMGKEHALWLLGAPAAMGGLAAQDQSGRQEQ